MTSSKDEYSSFNLNGEQIILIPGSRFSKMELKQRLKEMDIKDNNIQDKEYLNQLYDSSLQNAQNYIKIIQRLKKDTNNINSKMINTQRQSMPSNLINSNNLPQYKIMNISYDVKNYSNSREQQINIIKPIHTNKGKYVQNPFISSINGQSFNNGNKNEILEEFLRKNNAKKYIMENMQSSNNMNMNSGMNFNNELNVDNMENEIMDKNNNINNNNVNNLENNNISNINKINNNSSFLSDKNNLFRCGNTNPYEKINTELNDKVNNKDKNLFKSQLSYEEKIQLDEYDNNTKIPNNSYNSQNDQINYNMPKNERLDITPEENNFKKSNKRLSYQHPLKNDFYQNNNKNRKSFSNAPRSININEIPFNTVVQNMKNNSTNALQLDNSKNKEEEEIITDKNIIQKDVDEVSTFSFFSAFSNYKQSNSLTFLLIHLLILLVIFCLFCCLFTSLDNSWDHITSFFSTILEYLSDPKRILGIIISFISSIIMVPINNWKISIPIIFFIVVFYFFMKKYLFKKRCKEIIEKIVMELSENNNDNRRISEEDICKRYSQMYGISYNRFLKRYLPQIHKLRRNDNRLKLISVINDEKEYIFWELNE